MTGVTETQLQIQAASSMGCRGYIASLGDSIFAANVYGFSGNLLVPTINLACPGATVKDCLDNQIPLLDQLAGTGLLGIVVNIGVNDCPLLNCGSETGTSFAYYMQCLKTAITNRMTLSKILAVTPFPVVDSNSAPTMNGIAGEFNAAFIGAGVPVANFVSTLKIAGSSPAVGDSVNYLDGVHLNATGWSKILPGIISVTGAW
jgi:lysophospholipase L1-like esterase